MSNFPKALYKFGGNEQLEDGLYTTKLAHDADDLAASLGAGWHETTAEAKQAAQQHEKADETDAPEVTKHTRDDLEKQANELGIKFDARTSDRKLRERIDEALNDGKPAE